MFVIKVYVVISLFFFRSTHCMELLRQKELDKKLFDIIEKRGSLEDMRELINSGANPNAKDGRDYTPLCVAFEQQYYFMNNAHDKAMLLLNAG